MGITGLTGDETFTELVPEVLNISGGANLSDYFGSSIGASSYIGGSSMPGLMYVIKSVPDDLTFSGTSASGSFKCCVGLTSMPLLDTSNITDMSYMFAYCTSLTSIPLLNTSSVTNMRTMFQGCTNFTTLPLLNTTNVTDMSYMFDNCRNLTNDSLNNLLKMCSNVSSNYTGTKTLNRIFNGNYYNSATIEGLSNYQDFVNAGWTIS